jgi:hypothetical protein
MLLVTLVERIPKVWTTVMITRSRTGARRSGNCRSGLFAVIPTKSFGSAKQRNTAVLSPRQRMGLAEAMLRDVLRALVAAMELAGINVPVT